VKSFGVVAFVLWSVFGIDVALAGDLPLPATAAPSLPPLDKAYASSARWAGAYLGINGGYGVGSSQWTLGGFSSSVFNTGGSLFGGTVGFNYPVSEVLFGLEGDMDWSSLNGNTAGCAVNAAGAAAACETKNNFLGTARARMGYVADQALFYVTGGAAFGDLQTGLSPPTTFDSTARVGWAVGAGLEYAFWGNWSAKAEYLFIDFGTVSCTTVANCGSATGASVVLTESFVRGGLNYRFSW
jgi:outer membrane immunogenic protein